MIKIIIKRDEDNAIKYLKLSGHAMFDEEGKDIVCAGVSAVIFAGLNTIENLKGFKVEIKDKSSICVETISKVNTHDKVVLDVVFNGLKSIEEEYSKYVEIKTKE